MRGTWKSWIHGRIMSALLTRSVISIIYVRMRRTSTDSDKSYLKWEVINLKISLTESNFSSTVGSREVGQRSCGVRVPFTRKPHFWYAACIRLWSPWSMSFSYRDSPTHTKQSIVEVVSAKTESWTTYQDSNSRMSATNVFCGCDLYVIVVSKPSRLCRLHNPLRAPYISSGQYYFVDCTLCSRESLVNLCLPVIFTSTGVHLNGQVGQKNITDSNTQQSVKDRL